MKLYANCNRVFSKNDIVLRDENEKVYFIVKHFFLKKITGLKIYNDKEKEVYKVNYTPLKFKNRYSIINTHNHPVVRVGVGKKLIHVMEYNNKHYMCKGSFLKMNYRLYDQDDEIVTVKAIKKDGTRFFEITLDESLDPIFALMMLIVAQTIKDQVWFIYGI